MFHHGHAAWHVLGVVCAWQAGFPSNAIVRKFSEFTEWYGLKVLGVVLVKLSLYDVGVSDD